jgi:polysaccharide biosynthesis/export protein
MRMPLLRVLFVGAMAALGAAAMPVAWAQDATAEGATSAPTFQPQPLDTLAGMNVDYRLSPNDLVDVDVFGVPELKRSVRVNFAGAVNLPLVGLVPVQGLTGEQAEKKIAAAYAEKYLKDPQVSVFVKEFTTSRITVEGAVGRPGIYPVTGNLSLLRVMALVGGGAKYADLSNILLYRKAPGQTTPESLTFDLDDIRSGEAPDPEILANDVIVVRRSAARTALRDSLLRDIVDSINPFSAIGGAP